MELEGGIARSTLKDKKEVKRKDAEKEEIQNEVSRKIKEEEKN